MFLEANALLRDISLLGDIALLEDVFGYNISFVHFNLPL